MEARYRRAESLLQWRQRSMVRNADVFPRWIGSSDQFWYIRETPAGNELRIVSAATGANRLAFGHHLLISALSATLKMDVSLNDPQIYAYDLRTEPMRLRFKAYGASWEYRPESAALREMPEEYEEGMVAPDASMWVSVRDHNVWLCDKASGRKRELTTDGLHLYAYATSPDAHRRSERFALPAAPSAVWSPDSSRLLTFRTDDRFVGTMPLITFAPGDGRRPTAFEARVALPGDDFVTRFEMLVIDVKTGKQTFARYSPLRAVRMNDTPVAAGLAWWSADSRTAYFVDIEREERKVHVVALDADTGECRVVFSEESDAYIDLSPNVYVPSLITPLLGTSELLWFSERSGNAHLYLYDLHTGSCVRAVTEGNFRVNDLLHVDGRARTVLVSISGTDPKKPYVRSIARAWLDTGELDVLVSDECDHSVVKRDTFGLLPYTIEGIRIDLISGVSESGRYFVETASRPDRLPVTTLRDHEGVAIATVEESDGGELPAWWRWPEAFAATAADGITPINMLVFKPSDYDPSKSYAVIDHEYGGPQLSWVPTGSFNCLPSARTYLRSAALAELGFIVTLIDGRGTSDRDRRFHLASYGKLQEASNLEDHIAAIRQLAASDTSVDAGRVGIIGFSGGGFLAAHGILRYPEFYRVAVASSGNYDNRIFWHTWGERYHGIGDEEHWKAQSAATYANNLQGKLLLTHGLLDVGCHPSQVFQLIEALHRENKDYDLIVFPNSAHELPSYGERRVWDYLVKHLNEVEPPVGISITTGDDITMSIVESRQRYAAERREKSDASTPP